MLHSRKNASLRFGSNVKIECAIAMFCARRHEYNGTHEHRLIGCVVLND